MKILFVADDVALPRVLERAAYWAAWGHEVTLITSARDGSIPDGVRIIRIGAGRGSLPGVLGFMAGAVAAGLRQPRPNVVVVAASPQSFAAVAGRLISLRHLRPVVLELDETRPAPRNGEPAVPAHARRRQAEETLQILEIAAAGWGRREKTE